MAQTETKERHGMPVMPESADSNPDSDSNPAAAAEDDKVLKKRLLSRIAVAGVVILGLLGGLAIFDVLNRPQIPAMPKMAGVPIESPAETKSAAQPETSALAQDEKKEDVVTPVVPERTEDTVSPLPAGKPLTTPATPRTASIKPPPPIVVPAKPEVRHEIAKAIPGRHAPVASQAEPAPAKPFAHVVEGAKRFLVQVGVFSNHTNAEEMVQKLQAAGIPAQIESRVQVGPFASQVEANSARAKLKELGIDDGLLVRR